MWKTILEWVREFGISFAGLTITIAVIAIGVIRLVAAQTARQGERKTSTKRQFHRYLWNNNTPLFVGAAATLVTLAIALYSEPGPSPVLPKDIPTPEQRDVGARIWNQLVRGTNAPPKNHVPFQIVDSTKPLPWATGTWFWWGAFIIYGIFTLLYIPLGLWDEAVRICKGIARIIDEHRDRRKEHVPATASGARHEDPHKGVSLWRLLSVELMADILKEIGKILFKK